MVVSGITAKGIVYTGTCKKAGIEGTYLERISKKIVINPIITAV